MARVPSVSGKKGFIWLAWLLATCGFGILLGGVAAMQQACGASTINELTQGGGGSVGYLAPVSCDHLFQYTWWITFLHFFTWFLVFVYLMMDVIHKTSAALVGMLAVSSVLLMDTANTFLYYNYVPGLSGTMATRTKVTVAGAIVAAAADLLLILLIGWHEEKPSHVVQREKETGTIYTPMPATTVPVATTTTTAAAPAVPAAV